MKTNAAIIFFCLLMQYSIFSYSQNHIDPRHDCAGVYNALKYEALEDTFLLEAKCDFSFLFKNKDYFKSDTTFSPADRRYMLKQLCLPTLRHWHFGEISRAILLKSDQLNDIFSDKKDPNNEWGVF